MAQKKITDLTLRADFDDTVNLPGDDTAQTWRVTGAQMLTYFKAQIAPLTSLGDLLIGAAAGARTRLALGAAGQVLQSDGTTIVYGFPNPGVSSKTGAYTILATDNYLKGDSSSGIFTFTLPAAASGNASKRYIIKKTDSSLNAITITDGTLTTTLNTQNECIELFSTGSAWEIVRRSIPSVYTAYTPSFIGWGTTTNIVFNWKRIGAAMEVIGKYTCGSTTGTVGEISFPSGVTAAGIGILNGYNAVGIFAQNRANIGGEKMYNAIIDNGATSAKFSSMSEAGGNYPLTPQPPNFAFGSGQDVSVRFVVPVLGWNG
jgi:hypothetical protein